MANNIKIKYVFEETIDDIQRKRTTSEFSLEQGNVKIGDTYFKLSKISTNHISLEIDEEHSPKARFIITKSVFSKKITVPMKAMNLNLGEWLDFTDGETNKKHTIYLLSINYVRR